MSLLVAVIACIPGAFSVWLVVHIVNRSRELRMSSRIVIAITALLSMYALSFGPACWLAGRGHISSGRVGALYSPFVRLGTGGSRPIARAISYYAEVWAGEPDILARLLWEPYLEAMNREQSEWARRDRQDAARHCSAMLGK